MGGNTDRVGNHALSKFVFLSASIASDVHAQLTGNSMRGSNAIHDMDHDGYPILMLARVRIEATPGWTAAEFAP